MLSAFRAALHASIHFFSGLAAFLARAEAALATILPLLFFTSLSLVMPLPVFSLLPRNTAARALLPFAILLTFMAFLAFIAAFIAGFIAGFIAAFIAAFMGSAPM